MIYFGEKWGRFGKKWGRFSKGHFDLLPTKAYEKVIITAIIMNIQTEIYRK
jgi:hypothetical protein